MTEPPNAASSPAGVTLRLGGSPRTGEDRLRLLEAIEREGTITAAGAAMGLGYRATWDAVQALNNLFPRPLVKAQAGGRSGGAAGLTAEGVAALATLRHIQAEISQAMERLTARLAADPLARDFPHPWSLVMRTSARNAFRGRVSVVTDGAVNAEVVVDIGQGLQIVAVITRRSVQDLGLAAGVAVTALIKASFVVLIEADAAVRSSARNRLTGVVVAVDEGVVNSEVTVELADGKTLVATITRHSGDDLSLEPGDPVTALVKSSHVILAVE
jgi:molybdate transport system regulatory protein